jgi:gamma-glutamyltranspeptidase/glutathione hydrolase
MMGKTRAIVSTPNGMVATSQPLAVMVGLDVLKKGGNAIDAAVAANAMIGLAEPANSGIGGDLFVIYWDAGAKKLYGLNASGRSPYNIDIDAVTSRGYTAIPPQKPVVWTVPGCVDGWSMLLERFGTMGLSELLRPSIEYAETGFPIRGWDDPGPDYHEIPGFANTYMTNGRFPENGSFFKNQALADTYRMIAEGGRDAFYKGQIAKRIVEFSRQHNGFLSMKDFADQHGQWVDPVSVEYRGYQVWELPPNGQGIAALQMLNILEGYDVASMGFNSAEYLHVLIEAKKLAFADRARYYADPDFANIPLQRLLSKEYAAERRKLIRPDRVLMTDPPGEMPEEHDTIYMAVADKDGNMVSLIQSNSWAFGSGWVPDHLGFVLQNRGAMFNLDPKHPNRLEPHKRPFHTIIPSFVTRNGRPWLSFGVMGGNMQPQGHVQVLVNMIDFGMDIQEAGDAPRIRHMGSSQPWGERMEQGGSVAYEVGVGPEVIRQLEHLGHRTNPLGTQQFFGGYQAILNDGEGNWHGASDPRRAGCAFGY